MERRATLELRAKGRRLEGYAALYGTETRISDFTEIVLPGAFTDTLRQGRDVLALANHDPKAVLARTKSGTLRLAEDSKGLAFDLDLPDTSAGRDILALAERGDIGGASFAFTIPDGGERWTGDRRELSRVHLHEVSVVSSWPAYPGTTVQARHRLHLPPRLQAARRFLESC